MQTLQMSEPEEPALTASGRLRIASSSDGALLCNLFGSVPMSGDLVLSTRREPDFFALYRMQGGAFETHVYERDARLTGMGSFLVRDGWMDGEPCKVGYLGDLRATHAAARERAVARLYGPLLDEVSERLGCTIFLTSVMSSNRAALRALTQRTVRRACQPHYHPLRSYTATAVQFLKMRRPARQHDFHVRTATPEDLRALEALLAEDHRQRPFGWRFDSGELRHRLASWPGYSLARTYLAFRSDGALVGCATAWDPTPVKRYLVHQYRGALRWLRLAIQSWALVSRISALPRPGEAFRYFYLVNVSVREENPAVFRAILERIYADYQRAGYHFFSVYQDQNDPLAPALAGFFTRSLAFQLFAVTPSRIRRTEFPPGRTGFEIALA